MVHRRGIVVALAASVVFGAACKKPPPPPPTKADAGPLPADHLATGEIAEGREKAFALPLPYDSFIQYQVADAVAVESRLLPEELSNFVRARVKTTKVTAGAQTTTFDQAIVPSDPKRILRIDVRGTHRSGRTRSSMMVRDVTPLPAVPKTTDEDAWKKVGRGPDGKPLDPKHEF